MVWRLVQQKSLGESMQSQVQLESNDLWITEQVNEAFAKADRGETRMHSSQEVEAIMAAKKAAYFDQYVNRQNAL